MVVETDWVNVDLREASPNYFQFWSERDDLKGFHTNFETFFYLYLSQSDTCQLEIAKEKKRMHALKQQQWCWFGI